MIKIPKTYVGIALDASASMRGLTSAAINDFNNVIGDIRTSATSEGVDTIVSAIKFGTLNASTGFVDTLIENSSINALRPITANDYVANGNCTPLFAGINKLIDLLMRVPDVNNPDVNFIIWVTTDGEENRSHGENAPSKVAQRMRELQATGRWTFVFRLPRGSARYFTRNFDVPAGNVMEWETTARGLEQTQTVTSSSFQQFFKAKAAGVQSTDKFYMDMSAIDASDVKAALVDISTEVKQWTVDADCAIRPFCEFHLNGAMAKGAAFYQLMKPERNVQDYKQIIVLEKATNKMFTGAAARQMLGLPTQGNIQLVPSNHGDFDMFIQSTSVNRKLIAGTTLLYWDKASV